MNTQSMENDRAELVALLNQKKIILQQGGFELDGLKVSGLSGAGIAGINLFHQAEIACTPGSLLSLVGIILFFGIGVPLIWEWRRQVSAEAKLRDQIDLFLQDRPYLLWHLYHDQDVLLCNLIDFLCPGQEVDIYGDLGP